MVCSQPELVKGEDLLAYLAGEQVKPEILQHLSSCAYCTEQLQEYRFMELSLLRTLYRWDCPSSQTLGEYQLGMLVRQEEQSVSVHLEKCVQCTQEVRALSAFLSNDSMFAGTQAEIAKATEQQPMMQAMRDVRTTAETHMRKLIATLLPTAPRLAFQRSQTSAVSSWPKRYGVDDVLITMQMEASAMKRSQTYLVGFIARKNQSIDTFDGTPVQLLDVSGEIVATALINKFGNVSFKLPAEGTYSIEIQPANNDTYATETFDISVE